MTASQKNNYKKRHRLLFEKFRADTSTLDKGDIALPEAVNLEVEQAKAAQSEGTISEGALPEATPSEAVPLEAASSEAARVEAEKIKALQQKVMTDMEAKRERKAKMKEEKRLADAKNEARTSQKKKDIESEPEAEVLTEGSADTPAASKPKKSTLNLKSTSNVMAQILETSSKNGVARPNKPEKEEGEKEEEEEEEVLDFLQKYITSKDRGRLSSRDENLRLKEVHVPLPPVPRVAFGLDRVLFNPGVYQLRDPRSLVYNFDPYLDQIMPVTEFDFSTLKPYVTSSQDVTACEMTKKNEKKYYGSSSSMTSVLAHFHYLLSAWRPVDTSKITQGFEDPLRTFTRLLRAPTAMFLRYKEKEDIYAIDADKEYDYANILMNLGKSMEKQLTMPKEQFERYRRSDANKITAEEEAATPESYHYSTVGKFLMRSQLDAYDPRLPGTGMFDLKTRAVVSIRMEATEHERGMGYEIRRRYGKWESYEREYFDMIRAAFLKYSLQVRVGRMDGIFVAYHNIERIFGFQYIPLDEMDQALHGTPNTALGDKEFELSLGLWEKILDKATQKYPKKSLRFHFETREDTVPYMYIVAQPVTDEEIEAIQTKNKAHIDAIQDRLLNPEQFIDRSAEAAVGEHESAEESADELEEESEEDLDEEDENEALYPDEPTDSEFKILYSKHSTEAEFLYAEAGSAEAEAEAEAEPVHLKEDPSAESLADSLFPKEEGEEASEAEKAEYDPSFELSQAPEPPVEPTKTVPKRDRPNFNDYDENAFGMALVVKSKVNDVPVQRPTWFTDGDRWTVDYELNELTVEESNQVLRACKKRRNVALRKNVQDHGRSFFTTLKRVTDRGRAWRKRMDEKDRERGILVYKDSSEM
ncbi:Mitochondrial mRNA processing protein, putative [Penicillium digitatum PHI26]|uniref:Mitochondrial mRNA processing protein, putative n=3 Tax=Penicillium digitatum TaxID=36651 RepID=K9FRK2_PEND2|nr:Mitochondrial mRNA processing protein, putative [Penicillium digitatum Pd1]EKV12300.1 Mitochondrial mRNA processing protein, putative [Penicillium digitatum PHI26]EKV20278.1 Mitochondrial mRNA processing protein, putative [Penicillium digitatum Pd1]